MIEQMQDQSRSCFMGDVVNSLEIFSKASSQLVILQAGKECKHICKHAAGISLSPKVEPEGQEDPVPASHVSLNQAQA